MANKFNIGDKVRAVRDITLNDLSAFSEPSDKVLVKKGTTATVVSTGLTWYRFQFDAFERAGHDLTTDGAWVVDAELMEFTSALPDAWKGITSENCKDLLVVAVRDIVYDDLFIPRGYKEVRVRKGSVGRMNLFSTTEKRPINVNAYDLAHNRSTSWNFPMDAWIPLLSRENTFVKYYATKGHVNFKIETEKPYQYRKVGSEATVYGEILKYRVEGTKRVLRDDVIDQAFRDDDEVYIIAVDEDADVEEGLIYLIAHNSDGSGYSTWVREMDLEVI